MAQTLLIRNVRVFDGSQIIPRIDVLVQNGIIIALENDIAVQKEMYVIDGTNHMLIPGLIDAHTHVFGSALKEALIFGVTTELDMFTDCHMAAEIKREQAAGQGADMADLRSAGTAVTAPGGHCTEYGIPIPTINGPEEAQEFVDARIAEGSDYIKIIYSDGSRMPTISKATLTAVVEAAHRRGKLTVVHIGTLQGAREAIEVGADGLAHLFVDQSPEAEFGRFVAEHHAFVIPTLTVLESLTGVASGTSLASDTDLALYLTRDNVTNLKNKFPFRGTLTYKVAEETIHQLKAAGVPILAGTDAPNPGTAHGASIHRELELLVQAGLTPLEALRAATSVPANVFGLSDRGRIVLGLRADLVLLDGNPTEDITATRRIMSVWKRGMPVDRDAYRTVVEAQHHEYEHREAPAGSETGLISDFEDGTAKTSFGAGWNISTDSIRGGHSTAQYAVAPDGANGGKGSLLITGNVDPSYSYPWAGVIFFPASTPGQPANLSDKKGLSFWAKGDGKQYSVMVLAGSFMAIPGSVSFTVGQEWQLHTFAFSDFDTVDTRELLGITIAAGPTHGAFQLQIDDVCLTS